MLDASIRAKVWEVANSYYGTHDWAHGKSHVERVVRLGLEIGAREGANLEVIELAAILHDIFEHKETHAHIEGFRHEIEGAREAERILQRLGLSTLTIEAVAHCIETHRKRTSADPRTIEAKCLFDADKLDCLGAVGIIRCAFVSFDHRQDFYREVDDMDTYRAENISPDGSVIDFAKHSSNLEWDLSIKEVPSRMYTKSGRNLAEERARYMGAFFERFGKELKGNL